MERVQYQLERSIPQLQLLDEHNVFSKEQLRSITTQRQSFEGRLTRRGPEKDDFIRYAEFEQNLARLINVKAERIGLPRAFHRANSASHSAHIISIYERLVQKFKYDVQAWQCYIDYAKSRKMRVVTGRIYARALSLHPNNVALWLSAASYELNDNSSTTAARSLLQRALRINKLPWKTVDAASHALDLASKRKRQNGHASEVQKRAKVSRANGTQDEQDNHQNGESSKRAMSGPARLKLSAQEVELLRLWTEYIRMELVFIERLRRRWLVLGLEWESDESSQDQPISNESDEAQQAAVDIEAEAVNGSSRDGNDDGDDAAEEERILLSQVPDKEEGAARTTDDEVSAKPNTFTPRKMNGIPPSQIAILRGNIPLFLIDSGLDTLPPSLHFVFLVALLELLRNFPFAEPSGSTAKQSGEAIRNRLLDAVYRRLSDRQRWSWQHFAPAALIVSTRPFREASQDMLSESERKQARIANSEEMESHARLMLASKLRTSFSEDTDGLLDLADWLRAGKSGHAASADLAVRLVLQLLEASLTDKTNDGRSRPSLQYQRLAQAGALPGAVRDALGLLRPLCVEAPAELGGSNGSPKSEMYTVTSLLLELLATTSRSGIDEPNLLRYLESVKAQLIKEAKAAGPGIETSQMRAIVLRKKVDVAMESGSDGKKLSKLDEELREATSKSAFPTSDELWNLRVRVKARLVGEDDHDSLSAEWKKGLLACSNAIEMDSTVSAETSLWYQYFDWLDSLLALTDDSADKAARKAAKQVLAFVSEQYRWAIRETSSLLSRSGSGSSLDAIHDYRQSVHDLSILRYFALARQHQAQKLNEVVTWLLQSSFASEQVWFDIIKDLQQQHEEAEDTKKHLDLVNKIFTRLLQVHEQSPSVDLWITYLQHLASKKDMPKALQELQRSKKQLSPSQYSRVEKEWQAICHRLESASSSAQEST